MDYIFGINGFGLSRSYQWVSFNGVETQIFNENFIRFYFEWWNDDLIKESHVWQLIHQHISKPYSLANYLQIIFLGSHAYWTNVISNDILDQTFHSVPVSLLNEINCIRIDSIRCNFKRFILSSYFSHKRNFLNI